MSERKVQLEQMLLNKAIEENDLEKICDIELTWGIILGLSFANNCNKISKDDFEEIINDVKHNYFHEDLLTKLYEDFKNK